MQSAFATFRLPPKWFTDTYGPEFGPPHSLPGYKPSPPSVLPVPPIQYFDVEYGRNAITGDNGYGGDTILR
jgi:hypothetical protein